jgi:hypothetical protein
MPEVRIVSVLDISPFTRSPLFIVISPTAEESLSVALPNLIRPSPSSKPVIKSKQARRESNIVFVFFVIIKVVCNLCQYPKRRLNQALNIALRSSKYSLAQASHTRQLLYCSL